MRYNISQRVKRTAVQRKTRNLKIRDDVLNKCAIAVEGTWSRDIVDNRQVCKTFNEFCERNLKFKTKKNCFNEEMLSNFFEASQN